MTIGRLNHVGVATPSIEASIALYRDLLGAVSASRSTRPREQMRTRSVA